MANMITVTIGRRRNDNNENLTPDEWMRFAGDVTLTTKHFVLDRYLGITDLSTFWGQNQYNGVLEESFTVHVVTNEPFIPELIVEPFKTEFIDFKHVYLQDAIAVSFGYSELI